MNTASQKNKKSNSVKLFCSYCHKDEEYLLQFSTQIGTLKRNLGVVEWHDQTILAGKDLDEEIQKNMEQADIIVLLLSSDFLDSNSCLDELDKALSLWRDGKTAVIPIILRKCQWKDHISEDHGTELAKLLALPKDGSPIDHWDNPDDAWMSVYEGIKKVVISDHIRNKRALAEDFEKEITDPKEGAFLIDSGDQVSLEEIYVYPSLTDHTTRYGRTTGSLPDIPSEIFTRLDSVKRQIALISGGDRSGKTSLCQMLFMSHLKNGRIPVYLRGNDIINVNLTNLIRNRISRQYQQGKHLFRQISEKDVVVLVDDFHESPMLQSSDNKDKLLQEFKNKEFPLTIFVADDCDAQFYGMDWEKTEETYEIERYSIKPLGYKGRADLIKKWVTMSNGHTENIKKELDWREERVNLAIRDNSIPDYPLFILMFLQFTPPKTREGDAGAGPASYGYCYNAMMTQALEKKGGVRKDDIAVYLNCLMELAYYMYSNGIESVTEEEFYIFFQSHNDRYNLSVNAKNMMNVLIKSGLLTNGLYGIIVPEYVFYYFVARCLAVRLQGKEEDKAKEEIAEICEHVYRKKCSSVILFLIHHIPKSNFLIGKLRENMCSLFTGVQAATLSSNETQFFIKHLRNIPQLPIAKNDSNEDQNAARDEKRVQDEARTHREHNMSQEAENMEARGKLSKEFADITKVFRMLSIMGQLLKDQHGDMLMEDLVNVSCDAQQMALRFLMVAHNDLRKNNETLSRFIENVFLKKHIDISAMTENEKRPYIDSCIGFLVFKSTHNIISRISDSIGSERLLNVSAQVTTNTDTPAAHLVNISIKGWYGKHLDLKEIKKFAEEWAINNFLAFRVLKEIAAMHLYLHERRREDREKIGNVLDIPVVDQRVIDYKRTKR